LADTASKITPCDHCGLPARQSPENDALNFCCHGCSMAHRLQIGDDGQFYIPEGLLIRWIIAAVFGMLLLFVSLTLHIDADTPEFFVWFSLALNSLILVLLGKEVFWVTADEFKSKRFSLGSLIFIGVFSSYVLSIINILRGTQTATYFETSGMILVFYIGSLLIDIYLKNKIGAYSKKWEPKTPTVIIKNNDGVWERVSSEQLAQGDEIKTEAEKVIPADGILSSAHGYVREAHLTGEPTAILKNKGDRIKAGSIALDENLKIELTSSFSRSSLSHYLEQFEWEKKELSTYENISSRAASILLGTVVILSAATLAYYLWTGETGPAINNFLSVLIIGCPCAFAIATPAAIWITHKSLHDQGMLLRTGSHAIEELARVTHIIFDKTGTVTGAANIQNVEIIDRSQYSEHTLLMLLAGVEAIDEHPIAEAVREYGRSNNIDPMRILNLEKISGLGIKGVWTDENTQDHEIALLNRAHPEANTLGENTFGLFVDKVMVLKVDIYHPLKNDAKVLLQNLSEKGYDVSVISGDPAPQDEILSDKWTYIGNMSPQEKAEYVEKKKKGNASVLFIGDGLNDLLAMAKADSTIAMFEGSDKNKVEADMVFYNPDIKQLDDMLYQAKQTKKTIYQNFFWALIYNVVGLPLAAVGFLSPLISIAAMILSSIFVTANSLRLKRFNKAVYDH